MTQSIAPRRNYSRGYERLSFLSVKICKELGTNHWHKQLQACCAIRLSAQRYQALRSVLQTAVQLDGYVAKRGALVKVAADKLVELQDAFKKLPGYERNFVPRSEYLLKILQPDLEDLLFLGKRYEALFDEFESLLALVYIDITDGDWGPLGRFGWKQRRGLGEGPVDQLAAQAAAEGQNWGPLRAGLFQGSANRFQADLAKLKELFKHLHWW
jgi:hypothetical protein